MMDQSLTGHFGWNRFSIDSRYLDYLRKSLSDGTPERLTGYVAKSITNANPSLQKDKLFHVEENMTEIFPCSKVCLPVCV